MPTHVSSSWLEEVRLPCVVGYGAEAKPFSPNNGGCLWLQSSGTSPIMEIDLPVLLAELELSMEQFIDLCIMCGCDYASNIRGIGAVRALSLIKQHGSIEAVIKVGRAVACLQAATCTCSVHMHPQDSCDLSSCTALCGQGQHLLQAAFLMCT